MIFDSKGFPGSWIVRLIGVQRERRGPGQWIKYFIHLSRPAEFTDPECSVLLSGNRRIGITQVIIHDGMNIPQTSEKE